MAGAIARLMKININKTSVVPLTRKTKIIAFDYKLCESRINRTDAITVLGVVLDSKLYFH
jgi:hypothetical protein